MFSMILWNLTFQQVLTDIPHDFGALVVYTLIALFLAFIVWGSRSKKVEQGGE